MKKTTLALSFALLIAAQAAAQCGQWQPVPSTTTQLLRAVHFPDAQNGWVVGSGGTLLRSADGGTSWTPQTTALAAGGRELYSVHFANATTGWVVGAGGFVKKTTDGGGAWTTQTVNTSTDLYDAYFTDTNNGWIVGACGLILRTTNGGGVWTQVSSGQNYNLTAVAAADGTNVAAASSGTVMLRSSNSGAVWSAATGVTSTRNFRALSFSGSTGWAASTDGTIWKSANGGALWLFWGSAAPYTGAWQAASSTPANVYIAGLGGKLVRSSGTAAFSDFSDGIGTEDLYGLQMLDDNTGWAVGAGGAVFRYGCAVAGCVADSLELVKLYNATNGPGWNNKWDLSKPVKTWWGVTVNGQGCVTGLNLIQNDLLGTLHDLNLPELLRFQCSSNQLFGSIPDFSKLPNLQAFDCRINSFSGSIPDFNYLPNLEDFQCSNNHLSGTIPNFSKLPKLDWFDCDNNHFSSTIPNLSFSNKIVRFWCFNNQYTFSDILPNIATLSALVKSNHPNGVYSYAPQDSIFRDTSLFRTAGQALTIDLGIDAGLTTNVYQWYKNGSPWTPPAGNTTNSNKLIFNALQVSDAGTYHVRVTNPGVGGLTLYGRKITLNVQMELCAALVGLSLLPPEIQFCFGKNALLDPGIWAGYAWGTGEITQTLSVLNPGVYSVTVTDVSGCKVADTVTVVRNPRPDFNATTTPTGCIGNTGTITLDVTAGTAPYLYDWQDLSGPNEPKNRSDLSIGTYRVTVTDANGCSWLIPTVSIAVTTNLPNLNAAFNPAKCNLNNGSITLNPAGGLMPYSYNWQDLPGPNEPKDRTGLTAGNYAVTLTDANGCTAITSGALAQQAGTPPIPTISGPTALCNNQPISLDAGTGFTAYKWSNGATTQAITASISNNYTVTVTNAQGCEGTAVKTVGGAAPAPAPTFNNTPTGLCAAPVSLDAGSGYTSYAWSNGQSTQSIFVSQAGSYRVTVGDAKGCTGTASATLVQHPPLNPPLATAQAAACGQNNGSIALTASGGTLPYRYNWSHNTTVQNPAGLSVGPYTATVTDANNCSATATATILNENGPTPSISPTPTRCGLANGSIALALNGGTAPFVFLWNNSSAQGQNPVNLPAGSYAVTIRDARNCETLASATVGASQAPALGIAGPGAVCSGVPVTLRATPGFVNYAWSVPGQTADSLRTSTAGTYTVTATDANSCSAVATQTVSQAPAPALSIGGATAYCPGVGTVLDAGGNHTDYQWSVPGQTARTLSVNTAGTYTVTVSNTAGCTSSRSVTVREHPAPEAILVANEGSGLSNDNTICEGANVLFSAYGGTQYRFSINGTAQGAASPSALFSTSKLADGDVIGVWLLDANGCQDSTILGEPPGKAPIALRVNPYPDWTGGQISLAKACANQAVSLRLRAPQLPDGPYQVSYLLSGANVSPLITKQVDLNGGYGLLDLGLLPKNGATTCRILALRNAAGCERALTQNQVFNFENGSGTRRDLDTTICTGQVVVVNNRVFAQTGTYSETILRPSGCDSTVVLDLKVVTEIRKELSVSICSGQSYFFNGAARNETGFYRDTLPSIGGCDSLVTLLLSVRTPIFNSISASICAGKSFSVGPKQYTQSGNYTDTLTTAAGCDSLVLLRLTVLPPVGSNLSANICAGESFLFGGRPYTKSGRYTDTLKTWTGCDSLAHLDLTVLSPAVNLGPDKVFCTPGNITLVAETSGCNNCTYQWSSAATHKTAVLTVSPSSPTTYAVTVKDAKGCSNTDQVTVSPQQAITKMATAVLCDGGRYIDGTDTLYRPGDYVLRRTTSAGCDSLITLSLSAVQAQDFAARPDTGYLLPDERSAEFDILANDRFPDDKSLALIEPAPAHGDAKLTKLEQLVYTVYDDDFFGYDTIYYQLCPPQDCPEACDSGMLVLFVQSGKVEDAKKIMPNAFTPNGDGKNDVFDPLQTLEQNGLLVPRERAELSILNSFGETVFFKRPYEEWDGNSDGRPMPQATYYYLLRFGDAPPLKGPVTLFR